MPRSTKMLLLKRPWVVVGFLGLLGLAVVGLSGLRTPAVPEFEFLRGHRPFRDEFIEKGWGAKYLGAELRGRPRVSRAVEYSFQREYREVVQAADPEIRGLGGSRGAKGMGDSRWRIGDTQVLISEGAFDPSEGYVERPGWVLVRIYTGEVYLVPGGYLVRGFRSAARWAGL